MQAVSTLVNFKDWRAKVAGVAPCTYIGRVTEVTGPRIKAKLIQAAVGDLVAIEARTGRIRGQVVGIAQGNVIVSCLDPVLGIAAGAPVYVTSSGARIAIHEALQGCILNSFGEILAADGPECESGNCLEISPNAKSNASLAVSVQLNEPVPSPLHRRGIQEQLFTGIRAIDNFIPIGFGQRLCIMAEPGVGKSTLLAMIARNSTADVNVVALIGERGREVNEFIYDTLDYQARLRSVVIVATSDEPAQRRVFAAHTATRIAEYFRSRGKRVLLLMDSLTRLCRAYREVGLAAGEPPVRRGYPPSLFAELPRLIERTGCDATGSITALYTMLLSTDLDEDPMIDEVKGLTDGHLILRRNLAERGHYPAIDVVGSISRLYSKLIPSDRHTDIQLIRSLLARLDKDRELVLLSDRLDPELACALKLESAIFSFLRQASGDESEPSSTNAWIKKLASDARSVLEQVTPK